MAACRTTASAAVDDRGFSEFIKFWLWCGRPDQIYTLLLEASRQLGCVGPRRRPCGVAINNLVDGIKFKYFCRPNMGPRANTRAIFICGKKNQEDFLINEPYFFLIPCKNGTAQKPFRFCDNPSAERRSV